MATWTARITRKHIDKTISTRTFEGTSFFGVRSEMHDALLPGERLVRALETDSFIEYDLFDAIRGSASGSAVIEEVKA